MSGRIRSIKPEVLEDEVAAALSDAAWRLWVSLWVLADDHGDVRAGAKYLAASVWQDTSRDADTPLRELIDKGRVHPYAVQGQRYVRIHAWQKHQRLDNAGKPRVPTPEEDDGTWNQGFAGGLAESRGEPPRTAATRGDSPLARARARIPAARPRPPITTPTPTPTDGPAANGGEPPTSPEKSTKGARLPEDWTPSPATIASVASEHGVDALACVDEFRDYWRGVPGAKGRKVDWDATFRNRVRERVRRGDAPLLPPEPYTPPPMPGNPAQASEVARIIAETGKALSPDRLTGGPRG